MTTGDVDGLWRGYCGTHYFWCLVVSSARHCNLPAFVYIFVDLDAVKLDNLLQENVQEKFFL